MKKSLIILSLLLAGLSSCKKQVENGSSEFIGYWSGGNYDGNYGFKYLDISENSRADFVCMDSENDHDYHWGGVARANDEKLTIGGIKYFKIIEYPHPIDTAVYKYNIYNHLDGSFKIANWKMVLDGLHGSSALSRGKCAYYKADY